MIEKIRKRNVTYRKFTKFCKNYFNIFFSIRYCADKWKRATNILNVRYRLNYENKRATSTETCYNALSYPFISIIFNSLKGGGGS